jgi:hypothetical protein
VLPASKHSIERMKAVMAQASVKRDDNRILCEFRLCGGTYKEERMDFQKATTL